MTVADAPVRRAPTVYVDVLDVGHGSCVIVRAGDDVALVDAGPGGAILEYLHQEGITHIHTVVLSHADADHIGGLSAILGQSIGVDKIVWNGDALKRSTLWSDLVYQLNDLQQHGEVIAEQDAHDGLRIDLGGGRAQISILAPGLILRRIGAGGILKDGRSISSNAVSVVAQVCIGDERLLLIPGDLDQVGYEHLAAAVDPADLKARYLLLPHHGGLLGTPRQTAETIAALATAVDPEVVFVSNGRTKYRNPREDVLGAVRMALPAASVRCTQLSTGCALHAVLQAPRPDELYSAGWSRGHSCAGTTRLEPGDGIGAALDRSRHISFVRSSVPARLCAN